MSGKFSVTYKDYNGESSTAAFDIDEIVSGNIATITPQLGSLESALADVTIGRRTRSTTIANVDDNGDASASDQFAQREVKWLFTLVDSVTGETLRREVPCADLSLLANNVDTLDLTAGDGASLKSAVQAVVINPRTGNSVILTEVRFVGRNS